MSTWTTLGELPAGAVFEFDDGDIGMVYTISPLPAPMRARSVLWKRLNEPGVAVNTSPADRPARPLRLVRVGSADLERAFVAALVDDPADGATLNAFADWLRDQGREKDAANLQADWRQKVLEAVDEVVAAETDLFDEYGRAAGDYPRPHLLELAKTKHAEALAKLHRRLGVTDDRG